MSKLLTVKLALNCINADLLTLKVWDKVMLCHEIYPEKREKIDSMIESFTMTKFEEVWDMARDSHIFAAKFEIYRARKEITDTLFPYPLRIKAVREYLLARGWSSSVSLWDLLLEKADENPIFAVHFHSNVMCYGTIKFRDLVESHGEYWNDLDFANAVDGIDSAFAQFS